jgi:hypothetical protein
MSSDHEERVSDRATAPLQSDEGPGATAVVGGSGLRLRGAAADHGRGGNGPHAVPHDTVDTIAPTDGADVPRDASKAAVAAEDGRHAARARGAPQPGQSSVVVQRAAV